MHAPIDFDGARFGAKMAALPNDRQRAFVLALFEAPRKKGRQIFAATSAGYGSSTSTRKALGVIASRLMSDDRIQAAIEEESRKHLRAIAPAAVIALEKLIDSPGHKDHGRALGIVIDRADPPLANMRVQHEHQHEHRIRTN